MGDCLISRFRRITVDQDAFECGDGAATVSRDGRMERDEALTVDRRELLRNSFAFGWVCDRAFSWLNSR